MEYRRNKHSLVGFYQQRCCTSPAGLVSVCVCRLGGAYPLGRRRAGLNVLIQIGSHPDTPQSKPIHNTRLVQPLP